MAIFDVDALKLVNRKGFPDPDRLVPPARSEHAARRAPAHTLHLVLVTLEGGNLCPLLLLPDRESPPSVVFLPKACGTELRAVRAAVGSLLTRSSQTAVVESKLAVASARPPGAHEQQRIVRSCASSRVASHLHELPSPSRVLQIRTVLSPLQLARWVPTERLRGFLRVQCRFLWRKGAKVKHA